MRLYTVQASDPKINAQLNLVGRTHFVDDDTLRYHKSRVISSRPVHDGLLFAIITSDAVNFENTKREFRYSIFDLFGNVLDRPDLGQGSRTSLLATRAMYMVVNAIDPKVVTKAGIDRARHDFEQNMTDLEKRLSSISSIEKGYSNDL